MAHIVEIHSAKASSVDGMLIDFDLTLDLDGEETRTWYTFSPDDTAPVALDLAAFIVANPSYPVAAYEPPPAVIPDLAPYQFRAMLKLSGKQDDLYAFIEALPEPAKTIAQSKLEFSLVFKRDNDLVLAAKDALDLSDEELNTLWLQASEI